MSEKRILLGNEAIARGIVEAGCEVAAAYPGTPSSEILPAVAYWADELGTKTAVEWGANEKVAFEMAAGASFAGKRSCAVMKQVGLNVAADPFMSVAHFRIKGGFLLVVADDPGPHSSQTEQDSRFFAMFAKVPCFDPSTAVEAREMVFDAYDLSERHEIVTMLRPTVRVDHCRQDVELKEVLKLDRPANFERDVSRWVCLPASVRVNHPLLNEKNDAIREEFEKNFGKYNYEVPSDKPAKLGIIAGGISFSIVRDVLRSMGRDDVSILKIGTPYPLPVKMVEDFIARHDDVLILEETYPVIEMQIPDRTKVKGRWNGWVPRAGELLPEVVEEILYKALGEETQIKVDEYLKKAIEELGATPRKPMLCPGCPHRASFFSIRQALPKSINPSDIGCYTLGVNQKAVDAVVDMGASITQSSGLYMAHKVDGQERPIVATIGDSTFFHMGLPGLVSAVYNRHAFVLAILDNSITAMTGGQSHPGIGEKLRKGDRGRKVDVEDAVRACGVSWVKTLEAYDVKKGKELVKEAWEHARTNEEPAVLIFRHPCMLLRVEQDTTPVAVDHEKCIGCRFCIENFNCPALVFDGQKKKAYIDERFCVQCGVCINVCPHGAINALEREEA
ncbi:MAG: indolepyruvate ferredoxin oxidoreductase, alpha subunit [Synergistales bacterium]|nr:indolepyruvate ferredoxin oxidoreductase, alpha subunit [Synergistales bacterium]